MESRTVEIVDSSEILKTRLLYFVTDHDDELRLHIRHQTFSSSLHMLTAKLLCQFSVKRIMLALSKLKQGVLICKPPLVFEQQGLLCLLGRLETRTDAFSTLSDIQPEGFLKFNFDALRTDIRDQSTTILKEKLPVFEGFAEAWDIVIHDKKWSYCDALSVGVLPGVYLQWNFLASLRKL